MSTNPHLDMANDLFARMFGLQISPLATAEKLVADYSRVAADEAEHGLCALPDLTAEQMAEGDEYQKDCR